MFGKARTTVPFIHEQYLDRPDQESIQDPSGSGNLSRKWLAWLERTAGVRVLPRLAMDGKVTKEFETIVQTSRANDRLHLLKNNPEVYGQELHAPEDGFVRNYLADCKVICVSGHQHRFRDVYLPTTEVLAEPWSTGNVPMMMTDNPNDPR